MFGCHSAYGEPVEGIPFGRYRLVELLGRGGMGEVWRAHDTAANNRTVAIKLLPPQLAADHTFVQRFRRDRPRRPISHSTPFVSCCPKVEQVKKRCLGFAGQQRSTHDDLSQVMWVGPSRNRPRRETKKHRVAPANPPNHRSPSSATGYRRERKQSCTVGSNGELSVRTTSPLNHKESPPPARCRR
jgi:hypothetical protein